MPDYLSLGQAALKGQPFSVYLGTEFVAFKPDGPCSRLAIRPEFSQQHGYTHGSVVSYLIDNALSFAGGSVLGENVITVQYKVNYMRPPRGTAGGDGRGGKLRQSSGGVPMRGGGGRGGQGNPLRHRSGDRPAAELN